MTRGVLLFAHNSRDIDYALMSLISAGLASKNLQLPVSVITDESTVNWMKESGIYNKAESIFDKIILTGRPDNLNQRNLHDGLSKKTVPFINFNRSDAYSLTPYDETLLIDSDFLILSNNLNNYWAYSDKVLIGQTVNDIIGKERLGYHDFYVSDTGIHLFWATTVMFKKNEYARIFFTILNYVKSNYRYFSDLYRFTDKIFRNDIAFSITQHIMDGYTTEFKDHLPSVLTTLDTDELISVSESGKLSFVLNLFANEKYVASVVDNVDIHVMNKHSLIRNKDKLLSLI